jgi:circadian clock protein KaiB
MMTKKSHQPIDANTTEAQTMPNIVNMPESTPKTNTTGFVFRLYVAGEAPNSILALRNLKVLCERLYPDNYQIDVVDVLLFPERSWLDGVMVTPTVFRISPVPTVQIVGNLSNTDQVLGALGQVTNVHF